MKTSTIREHLRALAANVVDPRASEPARAGHARDLAVAAQDTRDALAVVGRLVAGSEVHDIVVAGSAHSPANERRDAADRIRMRQDLAQARAVVDVFPQDRPVVVVDPTSTGTQNRAPLIRSVAVELDPQGQSRPVVPGIIGGSAEINFDPDDGSTGTQVTIANVAADADFDTSSAFTNLALQLVTSLDPTGTAILDQVLGDFVDMAAEQHVVAALEAAAGSTRAAGANLATSLDAAESAAGVGGKGPAQLMLVNPRDWPVVRRQVASSWTDALPHPMPVISAGATPGVTTVVGADAMVLLVTKLQAIATQEPRLMGQDVGVIRTFKLVVRKAAAISTVTGIGS